MAAAGGVDEVHPQPAGKVLDERRVVRLDQADDVGPPGFDHAREPVVAAGAAVEDVVADDSHGKSYGMRVATRHRSAGETPGTGASPLARPDVRPTTRGRRGRCADGPNLLCNESNVGATAAG